MNTYLACPVCGCDVEALVNVTVSVDVFVHSSAPTKPWFIVDEETERIDWTLVEYFCHGCDTRWEPFEIEIALAEKEGL